MTATLLVEIRTEELPPKISGELSRDFMDSLLEALEEAEFADRVSIQINNDDNKKNRHFATPRRLAVLLHDIHGESPAKQVSRRGPRVEICRDARGEPTKALVGFMHSVGVTCEGELTEVVENDNRYVAWEGQMAGRILSEELSVMVEKVLLSLSAPRLMRWGENDFRFIRPVRGVLMMHGTNVIGGTVMNISASETTKGHPIMSTDGIAIATADDYEKTMFEKGKVIVDEEVRRDEIRRQLWEAVKEKEYHPNLYPPASEEGMKEAGEYAALEDGRQSDDELLYEVAAMCEHPTVYTGEISGAESLPDFCVVACMKKHQRFFPAYDKNGELNFTHYFVISDNEPTDATSMIEGFNSVLHARLRDLSFYYLEDKKHSTQHYLERLKTVKYHGKLGSQYDRVCRLQKISRGIAKLMGLDAEQTTLLEESSMLCKADLTTLVVDEYPEMEGKMSAEYFCEGETAKVVRWHNALTDEAGEMPRAYYALLLSDNVEKLVGMFGIGDKPTGSKDPHGLRSAAITIMRVLRSKETKLAGDELLKVAATAFKELPHFNLREVWDFITARIIMSTVANSEENLVRQLQIIKELQKSITEQDNFYMSDIYSRLYAVDEFSKHKEAETLIAAGKRINNIFRKSGVESKTFPTPDDGLFEHEAERALHNAVIELTADADKQTQEKDYVGALTTLSRAAEPVDDFFEKVMVNAEDERVRRNRFALLHELRSLLNCVAKLS